MIHTDENRACRANLAEDLDRLKSARNLSREAWEVRELPMPNPVVVDGQRIPASYANFNIANDLVLVPTFNDCHDRVTLDIIAECFPQREIILERMNWQLWYAGTVTQASSRARAARCDPL